MTPRKWGRRWSSRVDGRASMARALGAVATASTAGCGRIQLVLQLVNAVAEERRCRASGAARCESRMSLRVRPLCASAKHRFAPSITVGTRVDPERWVTRGSRAEGRAGGLDQRTSATLRPAISSEDLPGAVSDFITGTTSRPVKIPRRDGIRWSLTVHVGQPKCALTRYFAVVPRSRIVTISI